jgi:hypothetical protein
VRREREKNIFSSQKDAFSIPAAYPVEVVKADAAGVGLEGVRESHQEGDENSANGDCHIRIRV